jgi:hypothetical protein
LVGNIGVCRHRRCNLGNTIRQWSQQIANLFGCFLRMSMLIAALLLVGASASGGQISIGINIGPPPAPRVVRVLPPTPGPDFVWIEGYWYPVGRHYKWHEGYWTRPPYVGARWVAPHHDGGQYFVGYWDGDRGRFEHDHHWDRDQDRDRDRYRDHDDHHDDHDRH